MTSFLKNAEEQAREGGITAAPSAPVVPAEESAVQRSEAGICD